MTELFLEVVNLSISAGWLILALLILRPILKKAPRAIFIALWTIVAVKLVCPFSIESPLSLVPSAQTIPPEIALNPAPTIESGITVIDNAINPLIVESNTAAIGDSANPMQIRLAVLSVIWCAGAIILLGYAAFSYIRLRIRVDTAVLLRDNIFESDRIGYPFVLGFFRPRIYLPFGIDDGARSHVISHEKTHIRRSDQIWKPLGFLILTLHWFNPLVWVAYILFCRDIEFACDESVIRTLESELRADYSEALLSLGAGRRAVGICPLAFGESSVKSRVKAVLSYQKPTLWIIIVSLIACVLAAVCFLTDPKASDADLGEEVSDVIPLTKESAYATISEILETLTIHSDNTVSIKLPESLPISEDGKTELTIAMTATYSDAVGSFSADRLLDSQKGWQGGEAPRFKLSEDKGELVSVSLGAFYLTELGKTTRRIYATANTEANAPFTYDIPVGYTAPSAGITQLDDSATIRYRLTDNSFHTLYCRLPDGVMIQHGNDFGRPLVKDGKTVGSITLFGFGTTDADTLKEIDTAADSLPMQIFAPVALSNHAGYEEYTVVGSTDSGAVATAKYLWQDLSSGGVAASIPFQSRHAILAYDYEVMPYFVEIRLDESLCTREELVELAKSLTIEC